MKLVDYDTFILLPENTLYCVAVPVWFGELQIKGKSIEDCDYYTKRLLDWFTDGSEEWKQLDEWYTLLEEGKELRADYDICERDAMYDHDRKYLVYDKQDVQELIDALKKLL